MRLRALVAALLLAPSSVFAAGRLDVDLFGSDAVRFTGGAAASLWVPGDPRDLAAVALMSVWRLIRTLWD